MIKIMYKQRELWIKVWGGGGTTDLDVQIESSFVCCGGDKNK